MFNANVIYNPRSLSSVGIGTETADEREKTIDFYVKYYQEIHPYPCLIELSESCHFCECGKIHTRSKKGKIIHTRDCKKCDGNGQINHSRRVVWHPGSHNPGILIADYTASSQVQFSQLNYGDEFMIPVMDAMTGAITSVQKFIKTSTSSAVMVDFEHYDNSESIPVDFYQRVTFFRTDFLSSKGFDTRVNVI